MSMQRTFALAAVLLTAAGGLWWFSFEGRDAGEHRAAPVAAPEARQQALEPRGENEDFAAPVEDHDQAAAQTSMESDEAPVAQTNDKVFRIDGSGNLVVDQHTRLNLEALIARTPPAELESAKQEAIAPLSAAAGAQASDLIDRYYEYDLAQRQTYPPGRAPSTEEEALAEIDGLHALREAHFGGEVAAAFYAEEEALNRELLQLIKLEKDQSLTLAEKAERAQRARDALPRVDAVERRNRDDEGSD